MWSSADRLGFGDRGLLPSGVPQVNFGPRQGVHAVAVNLWSFHTWAFGGVVLVLLALWGCLGAPTPLGVAPARRRRRARAAELLLLLGHREHLAALEGDRPLRPLLLRAAAGAARDLRGGGRGARVVVASMGARVTGRGGARHERDRHDRRDRGRARRTRRTGAAVRGARDRHREVAIPRSCSSPASTSGRRCSTATRSTPRTRTDTLYAVGTANRDLELVAHYPEHTPYRLVACAYDAQAPLGSHRFPEDAPATQAIVTGKGARAQRLHVATRPPTASRCTRWSNRTRPATAPSRSQRARSGPRRRCGRRRPANRRPSPCGSTPRAVARGRHRRRHDQRPGRTRHCASDALTQRPGVGEGAASLVVRAGPDRGRRRGRAAPGADVHQS